MTTYLRMPSLCARRDPAGRSRGPHPNAVGRLSWRPRSLVEFTFRWGQNFPRSAPERGYFLAF
jgi:hypothetical protein